MVTFCMLSKLIHRLHAGQHNPFKDKRLVIMLIIIADFNITQSLRKNSWDGQNK